MCQINKEEESDTIYNYDYLVSIGDLTKKNICALSAIYPNSDSSLACDNECYMKTADPKVLQWYLDQYPNEMDMCNCYKEKKATKRN